jgi:hypothetical protein
MLLHRILRPLHALLLVGLLTAAAAQGQTPTVAAASDLQFALEEVQAQFAADTGHQVQLVFGSSGNLYRQIVEGAPFQMFLSADEAFVSQLADLGLSQDEGELFATPGGLNPFRAARRRGARADPPLRHSQSGTRTLWGTRRGGAAPHRTLGSPEGHAGTR